MMGMALERKAMNAKVDAGVSGATSVKTKNTAEALESGKNETMLEELGVARMLRCRVRISPMVR